MCIEQDISMFKIECIVKSINIQNHVHARDVVAPWSWVCHHTKTLGIRYWHVQNKAMHYEVNRSEYYVMWNQCGHWRASYHATCHLHAFVDICIMPSHATHNMPLCKSINMTLLYITLFRFITLFYGTGNIPLNNPRIQTECVEYST